MHKQTNAKHKLRIHLRICMRLMHKQTMHKDKAHAKPVLEIEIGDAGISARPLSSLPTNDEFLLVGAELDDQTCRAIHAIQVDCHRHTE